MLIMYHRTKSTVLPHIGIVQKEKKKNEMDCHKTLLLLRPCVALQVFCEIHTILTLCISVAWEY